MSNRLFALFLEAVDIDHELVSIVAKSTLFLKNNKIYLCRLLTKLI